MKYPQALHRDIFKLMESFLDLISSKTANGKRSLRVSVTIHYFILGSEIFFHMLIFFNCLNGFTFSKTVFADGYTCYKHCILLFKFVVLLGY